MDKESELFLEELADVFEKHKVKLALNEYESDNQSFISSLVCADIYDLHAVLVERGLTV